MTDFSFKTIDIIPHISISTTDCGAYATIFPRAFIEYARDDLFVFYWIPAIMSGIIPLSIAKFTALDAHI